MSEHRGARMGISSERVQQRRPRRRQGENRERLLLAGIIEFGAQGYHGSSTTAIAALAGVPQPHVYANFRTKQDLFLACVDRVVGMMLAEGDESPPAQVVTVQEARFVYQLVALLEDNAMGTQLRAVVYGLRDTLGADRFEAVLLLGAQAMLRGSEA